LGIANTKTINGLVMKGEVILLLDFGFFLFFIYRRFF